MRCCGHLDVPVDLFAHLDKFFAESPQLAQRHRVFCDLPFVFCNRFVDKANTLSYPAGFVFEEGEPLLNSLPAEFLRHVANTTIFFGLATTFRLYLVNAGRSQTRTNVS